VVVGQGVIGLATALALARRGRQVIAISARPPGWPLTSSHGASRSIRSAYADREYVRLALQAIEAWRALEREIGHPVLHLTGHVDLGPAPLLGGLERAMRDEGVRARALDPRDMARIYPELRVEPDEHGLHHDIGGTVLAFDAIAALAQAGERHGVRAAAGARVEKVKPRADGVRLSTSAGAIDAGSVVLATGPWASELLEPLGIWLPLTPAVAQVTYFGADGLTDRPGMAEWTAYPGGRGVYGHPVPGVGYKLAFDAAGREPWSARAEEWPPDPAEERELTEWVARRLPGAGLRVIRSERHPWTMTPDSHFVIDHEGPVVLACGCSGHAFKFGPALGELVADVVDDVPRPERELFSMRRSAMSGAAVEASSPITR
jgi:sarcosine oxidase